MKSLRLKLILYLVSDMIAKKARERIPHNIIAHAIIFPSYNKDLIIECKIYTDYRNLQLTEKRMHLFTEVIQLLKIIKRRSSTK